MKHVMLASAALIGLAGLAQAEETAARFRPYVGVDYSRLGYSYDTDRSAGVSAKDIFKDSANGVVPYVGVQFTKNLAAEVSYLQADNATEKNVLGTGITTKYKLSGFAVDAVGSLPVAATKDKLALVGSAGIGSYKAELSMSAPGLPTISGDTDDDVGYRLGAGAQYQLTDHVGVRAMARYLKVDLNDTMDHAVTGDVGLNYKF